MYRFSFGVIWIVLVVAIVMTMFMPDVYAQGAFGQPVACPPNCPNGTPAPEEPQAWIMWAWPDNTFRSAPYSDTALIYDHSAGGAVTGIYYNDPNDGQLQEVRTYNFVTHQWVSYDYTPDQDNLGQSPDDESLQRIRVRERLSFIETALYYAQLDLHRNGQPPQPVTMSELLEMAPEQYLKQFTEFGRNMSSTSGIQWPTFQLYINWLMTNADILDAEIATMPVVDATWRVKLSTARSALDGISHQIGAIINDLNFGPLGNTLGALGELSQLFGTAAAIANPDLARDLPIGSTLGDAIEYARGQLRFNASIIGITQQDILNLIQSNGPNAGEFNNDPCYMVFWFTILDGWQVQDRIFMMAQNAANYVVTDEVMARNPILAYADGQLGSINATNAGNVTEMFRSLNYVKNSVDQSGEQCVEGWQPTPDFRPDTFWSSNPNNRS